MLEIMTFLEYSYKWKLIVTSLNKHAKEFWNSNYKMFLNASGKYKNAIKIAVKDNGKINSDFIISKYFKYFIYEFEYNRGDENKLEEVIWTFINQLKQYQEMKLIWYNPLLHLHRVYINKKCVESKEEEEKSYTKAKTFKDYLSKHIWSEWMIIINEMHMKHSLYVYFDGDAFMTKSVINDWLVAYENPLFSNTVTPKLDNVVTEDEIAYSLIFNTIRYKNLQEFFKNNRSLLAKCTNLWILDHSGDVVTDYFGLFIINLSSLQCIWLNSLDTDYWLWYATHVLCDFPKAWINVYDRDSTDIFDIINYSCHIKKRLSLHEGEAKILYGDIGDVNISIESLLWEFEDLEWTETKEDTFIILKKVNIKSAKKLKLNGKVEGITRSKIRRFFENNLEIHMDISLEVKPFYVKTIEGLWMRDFDKYWLLNNLQFSTIVGINDWYAINIFTMLKDIRNLKQLRGINITLISLPIHFIFKNLIEIKDICKLKLRKIKLIECTHDDKKEIDSLKKILSKIRTLKEIEFI